MAERGEDLRRLDGAAGRRRRAAPPLPGRRMRGGAPPGWTGGQPNGRPSPCPSRGAPPSAWTCWPSESTGSPGDPPTVAMSSRSSAPGGGFERAGDLDDHVAVHDLVEVERGGHARVRRGRAHVLLQQGVAHEQVQQRRAEALLGARDLVRGGRPQPGQVVVDERLGRRQRRGLHARDRDPSHVAGARPARSARRRRRACPIALIDPCTRPRWTARTVFCSSSSIPDSPVMMSTHALRVDAARVDGDADGAEREDLGQPRRRPWPGRRGRPSAARRRPSATRARASAGARRSGRRACRRGPARSGRGWWRAARRRDCVPRAAARTDRAPRTQASGVRAQRVALFLVDALGEHLPQEVAERSRPQRGEHGLRVGLAGAVGAGHAGQPSGVDAERSRQARAVGRRRDGRARRRRGRLGLRLPVARVAGARPTPSSCSRCRSSAARGRPCSGAPRAASPSRVAPSAGVLLARTPRTSTSSITFGAVGPSPMRAPRPSVTAASKSVIQRIPASVPSSASAASRGSGPVATRRPDARAGLNGQVGAVGAHAEQELVGQRVGPRRAGEARAGDLRRRGRACPSPGSDAGRLRDPRGALRRRRPGRVRTSAAVALGGRRAPRTPDPRPPRPAVSAASCVSACSASGYTRTSSCQPRRPAAPRGSRGARAAGRAGRRARARPAARPASRP